MKVSEESNGETLFTGSKVEAPNLNDEALAPFVGRYKSTELDATYALSIDKGHLMLRVNWEEPLMLTPLTPDEFDLAGGLGTLVFHRDVNHRVSGLGLFSGRVLNVSFDKTN